MNAAYLQAAIPEPFKVLGRRLKPFSLGHQILLERFNSGFALGSSAAPTYEDLILSIYLCSFTFSDAISELCRPGLGLRIKLWSWKVKIFTFIRGLLTLKPGCTFNIPETIATFQKYIIANTNEPEYWIEQKGSGGKSGVPFIQFLKVRLEQDLSYTEEQALNTPVLIALWNYLTFLEGKGIIRFVSDADRALIEASRDDKVQARLAAIAHKMGLRTA